MSKMSLIREGEAMYVNDAAGVRVYKGLISGTDTKVAIKEQHYPTVHQANSAIRESMNMAKLNHSSICRVFDCALEEAQGGGFKSIIVVELMAADLNKRIEARKKKGEYWTEEELMRLLGQLVSALSYAQQQGISHRDIKPQNIFVNEDESIVKIGDFGSASSNLSGLQQQSTLVGSPLFLSPILKHQFITTTQGKNEPGNQLHYNPYKSDVYSLGVTFAYMSVLMPPMELIQIENLEEVTENLLNMVRGYQTFQWFLRGMLSISDDNRPDFIALETYLQQYWYPPAPAVQPQAAAPAIQSYDYAQAYACEPQQTYIYPAGNGELQAANQEGMSQYYQQPMPATYVAQQGYPEQWLDGSQCQDPAIVYAAPPSGVSNQYEESKEVPSSSGNGFMTNVKNCEVCGRMFKRANGEAKYCGLECEKNVAVSVPRPEPEVVVEPKCLNCKSPMKGGIKPDDLPSYLDHMKIEAASYCSMNCITVAGRKKKPDMTDEGYDNKCVYCGVPQTDVSGDSNPHLKVRCGHYFHNSECLFDYLRKTSEDFYHKSSITCPKCTGYYEDFVEFITRAFGAMKTFDMKRKEIWKTYCAECKEKGNVKKYECGHYFCPTHMESVFSCRICDELYPPRRYNR